MTRMLTLLACVLAQAEEPPAIPEGFPRFEAPGHAPLTDAMRRLYWAHYPGAGPKATLWDPWLPEPALWPAITEGGDFQAMRAQWRKALLARDMDDEGYVATHQHASIAHPQGWPFPFWAQGGPGAWGWHFSLQDVPAGWHHTETRTQEGWLTSGVADGGIDDAGWQLTLTAPGAVVETPPLVIDPFQAPFLQLRWKAAGLENARPYIAWKEQGGAYAADRRVYFEPTGDGPIKHAVIPMYRHPDWAGGIAGLRLGFGNTEPGASVTVQALFTTYDTRHNINNTGYLLGCQTYFNWTRDINFLRENIGRMRLALRYVMDRFKTLETSVVVTPYVGHDGRTGLLVAPNGERKLAHGHGIGNNYWDLLPFGHKDCYATILYYAALRGMVTLERAIEDNPQWNIPMGAMRLSPDMMSVHADQVKQSGNRLFWNKKTNRFNACIDKEDAAHDYGFTFLNLEAIYYGFATDENARAILAWLDGERIIESDTAQGDDIYFWRFGPRATTKRNVQWYGWYWSHPEHIPWGGQVQDGGAVLGFSYHDLMSRAIVLGADNAAARLSEIVGWYDDVTAAGGYRAYYDGSRPGSLQGGGTPGGLGMDHEFFESVLVPQVMLRGFLGLAAEPTGLRIAPRLPSDWPSLTVTQIQFQDWTLDITVTNDSVTLACTGVLPVPRPSFSLTLPDGPWTFGDQTGAVFALDALNPGDTLTFKRES